MLKELNLREDAPWKQRYRAPVVMWSAVASMNPEHGLVCTNKDGIYQLYAWDVQTGALRQLTDKAVGIVSGVISADGNWVYYLDDAEGNEIGHYVRIPFTGGAAEDITPDMPAYASFYITESHSGNFIGFHAANQNGFQSYVLDKTGKQLFSYSNEVLSAGPNLSYDGSIAIIQTTEKSRSNDFNLEAYDVATGQLLGELWDGMGTSVDTVGFIPRAGDERYLGTTNKSGFSRPVIWQPRTGERRDIELPELKGEVYPWDWSEDGRYLLLEEVVQATHHIHLYDLEADKLITLNHPQGAFGFGYFMGDSIFVNYEDSAQPSRLVELDRQTGALKRTILQAGEPPTGRKWQSITFDSNGTPIQAWLVTPEGNAPFPTIVHTHGGPTAVMTERFHAESQAWVDHGFAFLSINYHGSTTFGKEFEASIRGNLGDLEVEDIAAGVQWLIDNNIAVPDMVLKTGRSYGGYLTLQSLGKKPHLWAGGMAVVAIADWALMYEDQAETLRGYQRALFGGTPDELPEQTKKSSPITYAENIKVDLLVIQGRNDTRCPSRQMEAYETRLRELKKPIEVHWYEAGHSSRVTEEQIHHQELMLRFAYRVLG
jgi:dipeptidyl aminopeptidase/acylaminoacyl peptidase